MEINKTSWHFKMVSFQFSNYADAAECFGTSLCNYFWMVIFSILWSGIMVAAAAGMFFGFVVLPLGYVFVPTTFGAAGLVVWAVVIVGAIIGFLLKKLITKLQSRPKVEKQPPLFVAFFKAKKEKVCPKIDIV